MKSLHTKLRNNISTGTAITLFPFFIFGLALFGGCATNEQIISSNTTQSTTMTTSSQNKENNISSVSIKTEKDLQLELPQSGETIAILKTDLGIIKFKLFTKDIPELTKNFKYLADKGKYDGVPFHRVVKDFMIQTGDFTNKNGTGGYSYKGPGTNLPNEINPKYKHLYGAVSMAKTTAPVSIGSQFFIVTNKNGAPFLDGNYSPIGQVYEGMEVVEKIANLQIPGTEMPSKIINIKKVTIEKLP